jgi:hypothetical protein
LQRHAQAELGPPEIRLEVERVAQAGGRLGQQVGLEAGDAQVEMRDRIFRGQVDGGPMRGDRVPEAAGRPGL